MQLYYSGMKIQERKVNSYGHEQDENMQATLIRPLLSLANLLVQETKKNGPIYSTTAINLRIHGIKEDLKLLPPTYILKEQ